jgi:hypothetical protein
MAETFVVAYSQDAVRSTQGKTAANSAVPSAGPGDCSSILRRGPISQQIFLGAKGTEASEAYRKWQCVATFRRGSDAIRSGVEPGVLVYGVGLNDSVAFDPALVARWRAANCTDGPTASPETARVELMQFASPELVAAWSECQASVQEVACELQEDTQDFLAAIVRWPKASPRAQPGKTPPPRTLTVKNAAYAGVEGEPFVTGSELNWGETRRQLQWLPDSTQALFSLSTDRGSCVTGMVRSQTGKPKYETRWLKEDEKGVKYSQSFSARTENRHNRPDIIVQRTEELSDSNGRIYDVQYRCEGYPCGWSYHPGGGYAPDVAIDSQKPSRFTWRRKWDGDPALETYTAFYEVQRQFCVENCGLSAQAK